MNKFTVNSLLMAGIMLVFTACKHEFPDISEIDTLPPAISINCSTDTVYFVNTIKPLIISNCAMSGCHDAISRADGINLTTYNGIMREVVAGNATKSELYKSMARTDRERMPPPPMAAFTSDKLAQVRNWINQGARNNGCSSCDPTDIKFSTAVKVIIQTKCQGCHNPSSLGGGIDLSTYTAIKASALSGKLVGSISWASGFSKMPQNAKLPDCEITQIQKWVAAGSLNN